MQSDAAAQLNAALAKQAEIEKAKAELATNLASTAEETGNLKLALQREREAAADSKVQFESLSPSKRYP